MLVNHKMYLEQCLVTSLRDAAVSQIQSYDVQKLSGVATGTINPSDVARAFTVSCAEHWIVM